MATDSMTGGVSQRRDLLLRYGSVSLITLLMGGLLTWLGRGPWYDALQLPWFNPPSYVFTPVWTVILSLLAVATWEVDRRGGDDAATALKLYAAQVFLNMGWSLCFFTLARPDWALAELVVTIAVVSGMAIAYGRIHRPAGWMVVPYTLWLGLALAINAWIVMHN